jgi:hypothetical protein
MGLLEETIIRVADQVIKFTAANLQLTEDRIRVEKNHHSRN